MLINLSIMRKLTSTRSVMTDISINRVTNDVVKLSHPIKRINVSLRIVVSPCIVASFSNGRENSVSQYDPVSDLTESNSTVQQVSFFLKTNSELDFINGRIPIGTNSVCYLPIDSAWSRVPLCYCSKI